MTLVGTQYDKLYAEKPRDYQLFLLHHIKGSRKLIVQSNIALKGYTEIPDFWYGIIEQEQAELKGLIKLLTEAKRWG